MGAGRLATEMPAAAKTWNERLNALLEERAIKPAQFARQCKMSRQSMGGWTSGDTKNPRLDNFFAACDALKVRPRWLALGHEPMEPQADDAPPPFTELVLQIAEMLELRSESAQRNILKLLAEIPPENDTRPINATPRRVANR